MFERITKDRAVRRAITRESHLMFFYVYFSHYVTYEIAEFQKDIFRITENIQNKLAVIVAFRGSGKSTLVTFSYSLWAMLGVQQKKFVLIICQTQTQAKQHLINLSASWRVMRSYVTTSDPFRKKTASGVHLPWYSRNLKPRLWPSQLSRVFAVFVTISIDLISLSVTTSRIWRR